MTDCKHSHPADDNLLLSQRLDGVALGRTLAARRALASTLLRDLEQAIHKHPGPCPMQRYCLAACAMARQMGDFF